MIILSIDKKARMISAAGLVVVSLIILFTLTSFSQTFAGKSDQFFRENRTCEMPTDSVLWSAVASKDGDAQEYFAWTPETSCGGNKICDIENMSVYVRYVNSGGSDSDGACNQGIVKIANSTETDAEVHTRYAACDDVIIPQGETIGPRWECASSQSANVCSTENQGYNETRMYNVSVYADNAGAVAENIIVDVFNINYTWCWNPIIADANISIETGAWGNTYNFTINVTNPDANTTVDLWRKQAGGSWQQIGDSKYCANCSAQDPYNDYLFWEANFTCSDIGDWEFKFNATDDTGFSASASSTTNECLDSGNDCLFTIAKNDINISYISGDGSTATLDTPAEFQLEVKDLTWGSNNITEAISMGFYVTEDLTGPFQSIGSNSTNSTGNTYFYFDPDGFSSGEKKWKGSVASNTCYNDDESLNFTVTVSTNTGPQYNTQRVNGVESGAVASWGTIWNFSINASDTEGDDFNITLQIDTGLGYQNIEKQQCTSGCDAWTTYNFSYQEFRCANITSSAQYKFYAIDNNTLTTTTTANGYEIEKDYVEWIYYLGQGITANRTGDQTSQFAYRVRDRNSTFLGNFDVEFFVTSNNVSYYPTAGADPFYVSQTNSSGYAFLNFNATCAGEYSGTPKFEVGEQQWKVKINTSETSCYYQNDSSASILTNTFVWGDIRPTLVNPKNHTEEGGQNFTQEDNIGFLGSSVDDCGDALTLNETVLAGEVLLFANYTGGGYNCTSGIELVGANAYSCTLTTDITTQKGWYNASMYVNKTNYYYNFTIKTGVPNRNLFFMNPIQKLQNALGLPELAGWGWNNYNFSALASSGDQEITYNVTVWMTKGSPTFSEECNSPDCLNQTPVECISPSCVNTVKYWYRNFTSDDQGQWFYIFRMNNTPRTETDSQFITLEEDNTTITYGDSGEGVTVAPSSGQNLTVRLFDADAQIYNLNPTANVSFYINKSGSYTHLYIGSNFTNTTGYVKLINFTAGCTGFASGEHNWTAEVEDAEPNYKVNTSDNFTLIIDLTECAANIQVDELLFPGEVFINRNYTVNATVTAYSGSANDVFANITLGNITWTGNNSESLGTLAEGPANSKRPQWHINATTAGLFNYTTLAVSSDAGSDTENSASFVVYDEVGYIGAGETMPVLLNEGDSQVFSWACNAGQYRTADLVPVWNSSGGYVRVEVFNNTDWIDLLHSYYIIENGGLPVEGRVRSLSSQIAANGTGFCTVNVTNVGGAMVNVSAFDLQAYYNRTLLVENIISDINGYNTYSLDPTDGNFNVSLRLANSENVGYSGTLWLNITNTTSYVVNSSSQAFSINPRETLIYNVTNIPISNWVQDSHTMRAYVTYDSGAKEYETNRTLILDEVEIFAETSNWFCNSTTEPYSVVLIHPYEDTIEYNVSLAIPGGWTYSGSQNITADSPGNYSVIFNLTSQNSAGENVTVAAFANYTYPFTGKSVNKSYSIEENNELPIIEIVRETPGLIGANKVFESQLSVHNKGCATVPAGTVVTEIVSTGWTPANPSIKTNDYGTDVELSSATTDLEGNTLKWTLGEIGINKYAVLTYQIKSPNTVADVGNLRYNTSYGRFNFTEDDFKFLQTSNYTAEAHLEFDIEGIQQAAFPSAEVRSTQLNKYYNYTLTVTNVGDLPTNNEWNATLSIPSQCNFIEVYDNITDGWNPVTRLLSWNVTNITSRSSSTFTTTLNCTVEGKQVLVATGVKNDTAFQTFNNLTSLVCSGADCVNTTNYTFSKPGGARYEQLTQINFLTYYNWGAQNLTIAESYINFTDDFSKSRIAWQNYSLVAEERSVWENYTIDSGDQRNFVSALRTFGIRGYSDGTALKTSNVTLRNLVYTWQYGKLFSEPQNLFIKVKTYSYPTLFQNENLTINGTSSRVAGGWGETFNFSVEVRDRFDRDVTVEAWHKPSSGDYSLIDTTTCLTCTSFTPQYFVYNYQPENFTQATSWTFKFNATNADGGNETGTFTLTLEKDDINIDDARFPPEYTSVFRNETTVFGVRVFDRDNGTYPNGTYAAQGKVFLSAFSFGSFDSPASISSDDGWINRTLTNTDWCDDTGKWYLGDHEWKAGTDSATYYKDNQTAPLNFTLFGVLTNTLTLPDGTANYSRGSTITFQGSVADDCAAPHTSTEGITEYNISSSNTWYSCIADATGQCTIDTDTTYPLGYYNLTMHSNKTGYFNGTIFNQDYFFLGVTANLDDVQQDPSDSNIPWGRSAFNFSVNVTDLDNGTDTIYFWLKNNTNDWVNQNQTTESDPQNYYFFNRVNFTNNSIDVSAWTYKFNVSDSESIGNNETSEFTFSVVRNNIDFRTFGGNNGNVNRSDAQPGPLINLSAVAYDLIVSQNTLVSEWYGPGLTPNISLSNIYFWVYNGTGYSENTTEEFNDVTTYRREFNPSCNFTAGQQSWIVNVSGDQAYLYNSTETYTSLFVNIYADTNATYISPTGAAEYEIGSSITFQGNVTDDCLVDVANSGVHFNLTKEDDAGTNYLCSSSSTANPYSCSFDTTGKTVGNYNLTIIAFKEFYYNSSDTEDLAVKIKSTPTLSLADTTNRTEGFFVPRNFSVSVNDNTGDTVTVYLFESVDSSWKQIGPSQQCTSCSGDILWWTSSYVCSEVGSTVVFKFNATDTEGNSYSTSGTDYVGSDDSVTVDSEDAIIEHGYGNETTASIDTSTPLSVRIYDTDNLTYVNSPAASVSFNITKDGILGTFSLEATSTTNSTGHAAYNFFADSTFTVDKQNWTTFINTTSNSCYNFAQSDYFNVTTRPNVATFTDESVDILSDGWGVNRNFSVNVFDANDTATISLWRATSLASGDWQLMDTLSYTTPDANQLLWSQVNFTCADKNTLYFKFNTTNDVGLNANSTDETAKNNFTLGNDDVQWEYFAGLEATANRTGVQTDLLSFRLKDENGTYIGDFPVKFSVTRNNVSYHTDDFFIVNTNSSGFALLNFNATCADEYSGAPRFTVGEQQWKVDINDSQTSCYNANDTSSSLPQNLFVYGDQSITVTDPTGVSNATQGDTIAFIGTVYDDCSIELPEVTTAFYANYSTTDGYNCTSIQSAVAGLYRCDWESQITPTTYGVAGWYNVSMHTNISYYYDNTTVKASNPTNGDELFFLDILREFGDLFTEPTADGWGKKPWTFNTIATSGNLTPEYTMNFSARQSGAFIDCALLNSCVNVSPVNCSGCFQQNYSFQKNFSYSEQGEWTYKFTFDGTATETAGTQTVTVEEDDINISYGGEGSGITVAPSSGGNLSVRVYDNDAETFALVPAANMSFYVNKSGEYTKLFIGTNTTNSTGYDTLYNFTAACSGYASGAHKWWAETETDEPNYKVNISPLFDVTIDLTECSANIQVDPILTPDETFIDRNFTINTTVTSYSGTANDVFTNITLPNDTWIGNETFSLGSISAGPSGAKSAKWTINATTSGEYNVSIFANSSDAGTDSANSNKFAVYKTTGIISAQQNFPVIVAPETNVTFSWSCEGGDYRIAELLPTWAGNDTTIRIFTYNGDGTWIDSVHSYYLNESSATLQRFPVLADEFTKQFAVNESSLCVTRIRNIGDNDINITAFDLKAYYNESLMIQHINTQVNDSITHSLEPEDTPFNVSVEIQNSKQIAYSGNLWLNITNTTGYIVNSSTQAFSINPRQTKIYNFTEIPTNNWVQDTHYAGAYLVYDSQSAAKNQTVILDTVEVYTKTEPLFCNSTTEVYNVTIVHPFFDVINYNVTLDVPTGWSYTGSQSVNATYKGNFTLSFNLTSANSAGQNVTVNATVNYTYPWANKSITTLSSIQEGNNLPILETIRETPKTIANRTEFFSRVIVHNKGCADASSVEFVESISLGWTAYGPTIDGVSGGTADLPSGEIRFSSSDFGTLEPGDYKLLEYRLLPPIDQDDIGTARYNLTWNSGFNFTEKSIYRMQTINYSSEPQLSFGLDAIGTSQSRSADPLVNQTYNLTVSNIGDIRTGNSTWNVTLAIPSVCGVDQHTGTFNSTTRRLLWKLTDSIDAKASKILQFNMNCTVEDAYLLEVTGINDTTQTVQQYDAPSDASCQGEECFINVEHSFPFLGQPYERVTQVDFNIFYNWTAQDLTIGEGYLLFDGDQNINMTAWQNFTLDSSSGTVWVNYTLDLAEQEYFRRQTHNTSIWGHADGTNNPVANITIINSSYTWKVGKAFENIQNLFVRIKTFVFIPNAPVLEAPVNDSLQASVPIVLSWQVPSNADLAPEGTTISYYIFGDTTDGSTLLTLTNDTFYQWRGLDSDTFYWKVMAGTPTQNSSFSETRQFDLDLCQPDTSYESALAYPMSYNNVTDTITVWGSNGTGYDAMGTNNSDPITFQKIFEFGRAVRGICAVTNPATGSYAVLSRLEFGNATSLLNNITYVKTSGESIDFGKQLQLNFNSTFTAGLLSPKGNPYAGSTLSFSGEDATDNNEGEMYTKVNSSFNLYDSIVSHKNEKQNTNPFKFFIYGDMAAKRTSFENIWYMTFREGDNLDFEDIVFTDMGIGLFPYDSSTGFNTIYIRFINESGLYLTNGINITITIIEIAESTNDIKIFNYTGTTNLVNSQLNWSNINWTTGPYSGIINRKYEYDLTIADSTGTAIANASAVLLDIRGDAKFDQFSDSSGVISSYTLTSNIYTYNNQAGDPRTPHILKLKKYGKTFTQFVKDFSAKTVETIQLPANSFTTLSETAAAAQTGIFYKPPTIVSYGNEINSSWTTSGTLANSPVTQSEFFELFANGTKLVSGINYTVSGAQYGTGEITFTDDVTGYDVYPVYSYGGNITIATGTESANCISMSNLYDFMQANLSDVLSTVDGTAYTSFVDLIIGNDTVGGCIVDSSASLTFEDGYTYSFSEIGGYIDLFGVTAGSGSGGLPLNIFDDVGSQYNPGDTVYVSSTTIDSDGNLVSASVNVSIFYPNETLLATKLSTEYSTGRYRFNTTLATGAPTGTYFIDIDATSGSDEVHDTLTFKVEAAGGGSGGLPLNLFGSAGTNYIPGQNIDIYLATVDSNGNLVSAVSNVAILYSNGSTLTSGSATESSTGRFNFSYTLPQNQAQGTYGINLNATYLGNNAYEQLAFTVNPDSMPLSIESTTGSFYSGGEQVDVYVTTIDVFGNLVNSSVTVQAEYPNNTVLSSGPATLQSQGNLKYTFNLPPSTPIGTYPIKIDATYAGNESHDVISFIVSGAIENITALAEEINLTLYNLADGFQVYMTDFGEVLADKDFMAKIWITDSSGTPVNADSSPTIKLLDPLRNEVVSSASMILEETGIYRYNYTTSSGQTAGVWEAIVTATVNGKTIKPSDLWELETSPTEVKINSITDNTISTITADVEITNEGTATTEYPYEYCIVKEQTNQCGGGDDEAYASAAKLIAPGETFNPQLTLEINEAGDYWFKVVVYFGTERSGASRSFTAVTETPSTSEPTVSEPAEEEPVVILIPEINISKYPGLIEITQGSVEFYSVVVENTGESTLNNIYLEIEGIPSHITYSVAPTEFDDLTVGENKSFVIKLNAPLDAEPVGYDLTISAQADEDQDTVFSILAINKKPETSVIDIPDISLSTPRILVKEGGLITITITNTKDEEINITSVLIIPEDWTIKDSQLNATIAPNETYTAVFEIVSATAGLHNVILEIQLENEKIVKDILVNVNERDVIIEQGKTKFVLPPTQVFYYLLFTILIVIIISLIIFIIKKYGLSIKASSDRFRQLKNIKFRKKTKIFAVRPRRRKKKSRKQEKKPKKVSKKGKDRIERIRRELNILENMHKSGLVPDSFYKSKKARLKKRLKK